MTFRTALTLLAATTLSGIAAAETMTPPPLTMSGTALALNDLVADVTYKQVPGASAITVTLSGDRELVELVRTRQDGNTAIVEMESRSGSWNRDDQKRLQITIYAPLGTAVSFEDYVGKAELGDLDAPLSGSITAGIVIAGKVTSASLIIDGSGDVTLGAIRDALNFDVSGAGSLKAASAATTGIEISGSGDASVGAVTGDLTLDVSGSGAITVGSIDSKTEVSISGSGDVVIGSGRAHSLSVESSGSGAFRFGGIAVNPVIDVAGSGDICLGGIEGSLKAEGADVTIDPVACKG
jgi:hypothetical protein